MSGPNVIMGRGRSETILKVRTSRIYVRHSNCPPHYRWRPCVELAAMASEIISDRDVWSAIRYLAPESDHTESDIAATIAMLSIICVVCVVIVLLHLRGL
jgi:hypothetical protein